MKVGSKILDLRKEIYTNHFPLFASRCDGGCLWFSLSFSGYYYTHMVMRGKAHTDQTRLERQYREASDMVCRAYKRLCQLSKRSTLHMSECHAQHPQATQCNPHYMLAWAVGILMRQARSRSHSHVTVHVSLIAPTCVLVQIWPVWLPICWALFTGVAMLFSLWAKLITCLQVLLSTLAWQVVCTCSARLSPQAW